MSIRESQRCFRTGRAQSEPDESCELHVAQAQLLSEPVHLRLLLCLVRRVQSPKKSILNLIPLLILAHRKTVSSFSRGTPTKNSSMFSKSIRQVREIALRKNIRLGLVCLSRLLGLLRKVLRCPVPLFHHTNYRKEPASLLELERSF